jgi:hypothetical protein
VAEPARVVGAELERRLHQQRRVLAQRLGVPPGAAVGVGPEPAEVAREGDLVERGEGYGLLEHRDCGRVLPPHQQWSHLGELGAGELGGTQALLAGRAARALHRADRAHR